MKKEKSHKYLVLIPSVNLFLYLMHTTTALSDITLGILTGVTTGLSVLAIYVAKNNVKRVS